MNFEQLFNDFNHIDKKNIDPIKSYNKAKKYLNDHHISISTITLNCKLGTIIYVHLIAKHVILKEDGILSINYGDKNDPSVNRTIINLKKKKKKSNKFFFNQTTVLMKPNNNIDNNYINIKIFKNGSLQLTGCKDLEDFKYVVDNLIKILIKGVTIDNNNKKKKINFIEEPEKIGVYDVKIRMINSNFKINYKVDRKKLVKLLRENNGKNTKDKDIGYVQVKYDPNGGHSCVNIKYQYDENNKISIFVFQTGAIIITGAKNLYHIIESYKYVKKILKKYYDEIKIIDLNEEEIHNEIINFINNNKKKKIQLNLNC